MRTATAVLALLTGLVGLGGREAFADRLVMRDGAVVETAGPWEVKGRQVLFTLPNGTLSSLRADEVDFEASEALTMEVSNEPAGTDAGEPAGTAGHREPVLVITDDDIPRARAAEAAEEEPSIEGTAESEPGEALSADAEGDVLFAAEGLEVSGWRSIDSPRGGVEITGVLINRGENVVAEASVEMTAINSEGTEGRYSAIISNPTLGPGQQSPFRILLPDVFAVDDSAVFDVEGRAVRPRVSGFGEVSDDASEDDTFREPGEGG